MFYRNAELRSPRNRVRKILVRRHAVVATLVAVVLLGSSPTAFAFWVNLAANPDPNTGDFDLTWNNPQSKTYTLQELPSGGSWTDIYTGQSTIYSFTGHISGTFSYRLKHTGIECSGWPEPECFEVTTYSETIVVTVNEPPAGGGSGDPFPPPGPFTPPDDSDFPDATIVNPSVPTGDIGMSSVGALNGNGGVSGGQASYSIPIVVPPGRKGMQPSVSLGYSSSSGNGIAGVGWSLSAGSAISRCTATAATDGYTASMQYDANRDKLCLDGKRLVVATGTYGDAGATYRTELDIFARITQNGDINSSTSSFVVEYKNGRIANFGTTSGSRHQAAGRTEIMTWAIRDMRDRSGNTVTYDYTNYSNGEHRLTAIHYTGYNGSDGDRHVRFTYEDRPDKRTSYMAGGKTRSTKRLKTIYTEYQSTKIREYKLDYTNPSTSYDYSEYSKRSLLRNVQECAYENGVTAHCLPATNFEWQEAAPAYVTEQLAFFDPDGHIPGGNGVNPEIVMDDKRWLHDVIPQSDVNGDGVRDWKSLYVNAEGEVTDTHTDSVTNCFRKWGSWTLTCLQVDFDADGLTDSFRENNDKFEVERASNPGTWINTGLDWDPSYPGLEDTPIGFADFNGDGWMDLAFRQDSKIWAYFHTKNVASPYSTSSRQLIKTLTINTSVSGYTEDVQIYGDMDGNGTADFVVSNMDSGPDAPGLPVPQYATLTHSQTGGGMTTTTMSLPSYGDDNVNANILHDVNGDGLPDMLSLQLSGSDYTLHYQLNEGDSFTGTWTDLGFAPPLALGWYNATGGHPEPQDYYTPMMSKVLVMDYDGDGRQELLIADSVVASGCAEVLTTQGPVWKCDDQLYSDFDINPNTVIGAFINSAVADNSVRTYDAWTFNEDASGTITASSYSTGIVASAAQTAVVDATGDGLPDVVTALGCRVAEPTGCRFNDQTASLGGTVNSTYQNEGAWINRNLGTTIDNTGNSEFEYAGYDLMRAAEDSLGNRHEWTYRPLSSDKYSTSDSEYYTTTHSAEAADVDYFHFASSMNVVADYRASNGIGGLNSTKYRYRGAIFNNKGRGFQGFKSIIVEEDVYADAHPLADTDKTTRTDFHQKWPISSIVDKACTWIGDGHAQSADDNPSCLSVISRTSTNTIHDVATTAGARFVAVADQTVETSDLLSPSIDLVTKQTIRGFDTAGNVTSLNEHHTDDWTTNHTQTTATYTLDWSGWWLDKLNTKVVTNNPVTGRHASTPAIAAGTDNTKIVTTSYTTYDTTHRLPTTVTVAANDTSLTSTVTSVYNTYGLPTDIATTGTDVTGPRSATTTYSKNGTTQAADGYFPFSVTNTLSHVSTQHTDAKHGLIIDTWDPNNLQSTTSYDPFGRISETAPAGQPTAYQRFFWCDGAPACPASAEYVVRTLASGAPESNTYFDQFGRDVQSSVKTHDSGSDVNVVKTHDERGNLTFVSQPYDLFAGESATVGTRYLAFDALGRLTSKEVDQTNSQVLATSYTHSGFTTSINAGSLPTMHRIYNGLGQLVQTKDAAGGFTRYAYDGAGNPILLQDPVMDGRNGPSSTPMAIKASFNALGFKEWVEDPDWWNSIASDYGRKHFTYSGLGEVLSESDPNGNLIEMVYDELGRMVQRSVNSELEALWAYDSTETYKGLGLLDYEDSQFRADGSRLQKFYYYSAATTGRKDLLQVSHRFYENDDQNDFEEYDTAYFADSHYARPKGLRYPGGASLAYLYNTNGFLTEEKDPVNNVIYRQVTDFSSRGQATTVNVANHSGSYQYSVTNTYFVETGQSNGISVNSTLLDLGYTYDVYGNLATRSTAQSGGTTETFGYDHLHRLTSSQRSYSSGGPDTVTYGFDAAGNLTSKSDYGTLYTYHSDRPHVINQVTLTGSGSVTFTHDENGNLTQGDGETIVYNAFNKPELIENLSQTVSSTFTYGADLMRYRHITASGSTIYYVDKLMEIETTGSNTDYRHYLSDVAILTKTGDLNDPSPGIQYTFRDRLGTIALLADKTGLVAEHRGSDAYGKPRNADWKDKTTATLNSSITDRGFTDHEHLDDWQLIHMNGRGYDYNLGRFLSVDPIIQSPGNSQSINGFAYIMNNPLSGTDPTGYQSIDDQGEEQEPEEVASKLFGTHVTGRRTAVAAGKYSVGSDGSVTKEFFAGFSPAAGGDNGASGSGVASSSDSNAGSGSNTSDTKPEFDRSMFVPLGPYESALNTAMHNLENESTSLLDKIVYGLGAIGVAIPAGAESGARSVLNIPHNASMAGQKLAEGNLANNDLDKHLAYLGAIAHFSEAVVGAGVIVPTTWATPKPSVSTSTAVSKTVHGNSRTSTRPQHRYEIADESGDVVKTGISGRPLNQNGASGRANTQVNTLNRADDGHVYTPRVAERNIPGRQAALDAERAATNQLARDGNTLRLQQRPKKPQP